MRQHKIVLLPGDGIGPEVVAEVKKIIEWLNKKKSLDFVLEEALVGGASYEKHKKLITDEPNGCHFGFSDELFLFVTSLDNDED